MAWYDGTHACGHEGRINVVGPTKDRQWKVDNHFEKLCPECWEAEKQRRFDEENTKAAEAAAEMELQFDQGTIEEVNEMIRIGLGPREKQKEVDNYLKANEIKKVFCFYFKKFPVKYKADCEIEYIEHADIEMYKYFYRLLEEIDSSSLIIIDGCLRTQRRNELIYNCAHHYLNQTPHRIIFEYFPIIESKDDFMILLDLENKGKYKGKSFDYIYLQEEDVKIKPVKIRLETIPIETSEKDVERYEKKREQLFAALGERDPDTVPRALQLFAGDLKKKAIEPDKLYVARNKRHKLDNVYSYDELIGKAAADNYIVVDTHYRRLDFNDFLKTVKANKIKYLCTTLPIDNVIITDFARWEGRLKSIYAQASLYK